MQKLHVGKRIQSKVSSGVQTSLFSCQAQTMQTSTVDKDIVKGKSSQPTIREMQNAFKAKLTSDYCIDIEQNDVLQFLSKQAEHSIDLIVTDPAYSGMNNHLRLGNGRIVGKYADKGKSNGKWFREFEDNEENYRTFLSLCKKVLKTTGHIYIMFDSFSLLSLGPIVREYFNVKNIISWDKINIGMGHYFRRRHEFIIFATNNNTVKIKNRCFPDVWKIKRIHSSVYATQKPVELFDIMLSASSAPGYKVCDPFLGSGSSALSAIKYQCDFIGCDISNNAIQVSSKRLKNFLRFGIDIFQKTSCIPEGLKKFW